MAWEGLFAMVQKLGSESVTHYGICKVVVKKHRGHPIDCADGTRIEKGDRIGELHLDNTKVLALTGAASSERAALTTARLARDSLKQIQHALHHRDELSEVKALVGVTLLHRGLIHGLGFEQRALPSGWFERSSTVYLRLLLRFLHPEGRGRIRQRREKLVPMMLIHTRGTMARRFSS
ncbi:polysaccharide deacetylase [Cohnella nanjingensis]|uniref:Polysaccharide deacetylase n=2 Tax=Cohnella nanjingensis TaxID=1387779 RepID=A0A7X0RPR3_9BACL|nr:polysaccharide deacetylase [Cohnella nanjingensis]